MTRGDKFIQDMTAKGWGEKQLRMFVETGNCLDLYLLCDDCPFKGGDCPNKDVAEYFKEEINEENEMKPNEMAELSPMCRNTIAEMHQIIDAIDHGAVIQCYDEEDDEWKDTLTILPNFNACKYRVKPDERKKCWRPFKDADEFRKAAGGLNSIWLKHTIGRWEAQVTYISHSDTVNPICIGPVGLDFDTLFKLYTFADGRPCGVENDA